MVPIYPTNSPEECEWVVGNSQARAIVAENAAQLAKIEQVRAGLPDLEHTIGIEAGGGEVTLDQLRERGRSGGDREELQPPAGGDQAAGCLHVHLHVGHHGAAEGLRADPRQCHVGLHDGRGDRLRQHRRRQLPVPPAGARVRAHRAGRLLRRRHGDRLLRRRHAQDRQRDRRVPAHLPAVRPAHLREALHDGHRAARAGLPRGSRAVPEGGRARHQGAPDADSAARRFPSPSSRRSTRPTSRSSSTCASCSAGACARRSPARRRSRRRSCASSTPPACRCSRAGA